MQWAVLAFASPYLLPLSAAATPSMSLLRSNTCTSSSSARIGAKYCLNSGFASRVDKLQVEPLSFQLSMLITFTASSGGSRFEKREFQLSHERAIRIVSAHVYT